MYLMLLNNRIKYIDSYTHYAHLSLKYLITVYLNSQFVVSNVFIKLRDSIEILCR